MIDAAPVGSRLHHAGGKQRLDLGGEEQPIALAGPEQWADADAIAGQDQRLLSLIPERDGKLTANLVEHPLAVILPEVGKQLGVAVGAELVSAASQLRLLFRILEQFAVEDDGDRAVLVRNRLPAVREADDA